MSDRNNTPRNPGVSGGNRGSGEPTPEGGMELDQGRVQFAPREADVRDAASGTPNLQPSDAQVRQQVYDLMTGENWVDAAGIDVHADNGTVTLTGLRPVRRMRGWPRILPRRSRPSIPSIIGFRFARVKAIHHSPIIAASGDPKGEPPCISWLPMIRPMLPRWLCRAFA